MPAPTDITTLSTTAASNSPAGTESPIITDDCLRAAYGFIAQLRDGAAFTSYVRGGTGGSATIPAFGVNGDTNTGMWFPAADVLAFTNGGTESLRINSSGVMLQGHTSSLSTRVSTTSVAAKQQIAGNSISTGAQLQAMYSATAGTAPYATFARSKSATIGTHSAVAAGDVLGAMSFAGSDGTQFTEAARIRVVCDTGTVATDTMFGRIDFMTCNGAATPAVGLSLLADGTVDLPNDATISGAITVTNNSTFGGSLTSNSLSITNNATIGGTLGVTGTATFADAISVTGNSSVAGNLLVQSATSVLGYGIGSGGTVTQATSKSTGVTVDRASGQITMNGAQLNAATSVSFTLTNSVITATDVVIANIASGATANSYSVTVDAVAAGSCRIQLRNVSAGNLSEAVVINFAVINGASS